MINKLFTMFLLYKCVYSNLDWNTIYELGKMSHNTYIDTNDKRWLNTTLNNVLNISVTDDTVKAYLFSNNDKTKNVISIKGTSIYFGSFQQLDTIEMLNDELINDRLEFKTLSTISNDKWNDNLFFSCCFNKKANIKDCLCDKLEKNICCINCYKQSLEFEKNYLVILNKIMENVNNLIDIKNSELIFTGHSLGGLLASYLGIKYNKLTVTFESPGDMHYFLLSDIINKDLNYNNIYHYGHNADPIFMGDCGNTCALLGYYINTKCHVGNTCLYDAKNKLNFTESILNHRIDVMLNDIIPNWETDLPICNINKECKDCENWEYV